MIVRTDEAHGGVDSPAAWFRLVVAMTISTIGGVGMWSVVVALPAIQAEFGVARADASLPYTLTMLGFALGGVADGPARRPLRHRACRSIVRRAALALGYIVAGAGVKPVAVRDRARLLIGVGSSATLRAR